MKNVIIQCRDFFSAYRSAALMAALICTTLFTACQKDIVEINNPTTEQLTVKVHTQTLSVSMIGASDDADYLTVFFNESAAVYRISKQETAIIETLNAAKTNNIPVVVAYDSEDNRTITHVSSASNEAVAAYKEAVKNALPAKPLEEDLTRTNLETRSTDIVIVYCTQSATFALTLPFMKNAVLKKKAKEKKQKTRLSTAITANYST